MRVHLTLKSNNAKTGPIPVSTTARESCPPSCGMKEACYAAAGPLALHWAAVSDGTRGTDWQAFCDAIASLPDGQLWRHNQAGDLPRDGARIDSRRFWALVMANRGRRGFTYTHHVVRGRGAAAVANRIALRDANAMGFTVNLSADNVSDADALADLQCGPVVCVLPKDQTTNTQTPAGRRVVVCPATQRDDVSCATCQLCQRQRDVIVGFPAHGTSARKADAIARRVIAIKPAR